MNSKKIITQGSLLLALAFPLGGAIMHPIEAHAEDKVVTTKPDYIKPVLKVNGNTLGKDQAILAGDTVTWDIINTPGNTGLVKEVKDTLPEGLAFNPNSKYAIEFFIVNNDGTYGENDDANWNVTINGNSFTAIPKDPYKYFYVGSSTHSRFAYRITTVAKDNIPAGTVLINNESMTVENPKSKKKTEVKSKAQVHTPEYTKPSIVKSESMDGGKSWTSDLSLPHKGDNYMYRITVALPAHYVKNEFSISDDMENLIDASDAKIYFGNQAWTAGSKLQEVTNSFDIKEDKGSNFSFVAKQEMVKQLRESKTQSFVTVVVTKNNLKAATQAEIDKYGKEGVPNKATAKADNNDLTSNTVWVHTPKEGNPSNPSKQSPKTPLDKVANIFLPDTGESTGSYLARLGALFIALGAGVTAIVKRNTLLLHVRRFARKLGK